MRHAFVLLPPLFALSAAAQQANLFETRTTDVAIYTDGLSYFVREGTANPTDGWAMTNFLPTVISGTLRVHPLADGVRVDSLIATDRNDIPFDGADSLRAALEPYLGTQVRLEWEGGSATGKLEFLLPEMAILTEGKSSSAVRYDQVKTATLLGYPLRMLFEMPAGRRDVPLLMGYLQGGLSWQGSYEFDIRSDTEAVLAYRATVVNNAEDLQGADVTFVIGSPTVAMRGATDPISQHAAQSEEILLGARLKAKADKDDARGGRVARDELERQQAGYFEAGKPTGEGHANFSEFHFYRKPGVSLRKGDVGQISLFATDAIYRSDFEWDTSSADVWHYTRVKNEGDEPWQPGPVLALRNGRSLGQGMIAFTPPGEDATLAAAKVTDVKGEVTERETGRLAEREFGRSVYVPVQLEGTLALENLRDVPVELKITHRVEGAELKASDGGEVSQTDLSNLNAKNVISWKITIPANTKKTLTYTYTRFVQAGTR